VILVANLEQEPFSAAVDHFLASIAYYAHLPSPLHVPEEATMSLQPQVVYLVPDETARVARAIFPAGNLTMRIYDELGMLFQDHDFLDLFPIQGQPAEAPARLALVTLVQFMEGLTDRQAADAVRTRIDLKYLLCLDLTDRGFDHTVLSEFRTRLLAHSAERRLFERVLELARSSGLLQAGGRQRSDSTHILGAMRFMTRIEGVTETLRHALNVLATEAPTWLRHHTSADWVDRYSRRASDYRLPKGAAKRLALARQTGADGMALLEAIFADHAPRELRALPAVETLRQVWIQNFTVEAGQLCWRDNDNLPPSGRYISSPYDTDARYATKRTTAWTGYKIHLTETCDDERPNLITDVQTTAATVADDAVTAAIHATLAEQELLPERHIADTGFVNSKLLVDSEQLYGIDLIGPTRDDHHWQAKDGAGFAACDFVIDWEHQQARCPAGKLSNSWTPAIDRYKNEVVKLKWATTDCQACPSCAQCTRSKPPRRTITIRPQAQHEALLAGRARESTDAYRTEYAKRAGVEGTIAQSVRSCEVRRSRYFGQERTHLQHLMTAAAMNVVRMLHWLAEVPKAKTRPSAFARLYSTTA
jgi:transposase